MFERKGHAAGDFLPRAGQATQQTFEASQRELADLALADALVLRGLFAVGGIDVRHALYRITKESDTPRPPFRERRLTSSSKTATSGGS